VSRKARERRFGGAKASERNAADGRLSPCPQGACPMRQDKAHVAGKGRSLVKTCNAVLAHRARSEHAI